MGGLQGRLPVAMLGWRRQRGQRGGSQPGHMHSFHSVPARPHHQHTRTSDSRLPASPQMAAPSLPTPNLAPAPPLVIIGASGRVGRALVNMAAPQQAVQAISARCAAVELRRRLAAAPPAAPLLVSTTNNALEHVIAACPPDRRRDLVLLQNGMLLPLLERHGRAAGSDTTTQALLYLAAGEDGSVTDGGRTVACGRHAEPLAALLQRGGVRCRTVGRSEYLPLMVEKLLWASITWLLSSALGGVPAGAIASQHSAAVEALAAELLPLAQAYVLATAGAADEGLEQVRAGGAGMHGAPASQPGHASRRRAPCPPYTIAPCRWRRSAWMPCALP